MNPRTLLVSALSVIGAIAVPSFRALPASAAKTVPVTTTIPHVAAKAALPEPFAVQLFDDEDGDGVSDSVPAAAAREAAPPLSANGWRCPVANAKFTNDWGQARSGGRAHEGTDMLAPRGTPIFAPIAGVVKFDTSSRGGLSFYLDAPGGLQIYGAHLDSAGASGKVESGTVIGYVGDSGNAKGTPHLHFEVHPSKKSKTNPYALLKQIC